MTSDRLCFWCREAPALPGERACPDCREQKARQMDEILRHARRALTAAAEAETTDGDTMIGSPRRARGRLLASRPAPAAWTGGYWTPSTPVRRCSCGAPVIVRSRRFVRCERGCLHLAPRPARPAPAPVPEPVPERLVRIGRDLRLLEQDFQRQARKGKRPSARAVALALEAAKQLEAAYPDHAEELWRARRRAELAHLAGRAA